MKPDWHDLIQRSFAGSLSDAEFALLQEELRRNDSLATLYLRHLHLTIALEGHASARAESTAHFEPVPIPHPPSPRRSPFLFQIAAAAVLLALLGTASLWFRAKPALPFAVLSASPEASASVEAYRQHPAASREFHLPQGHLVVQVPSGVRLELSAPARLQFLTPMRVRVLSGKITADVGERGKGFVLETPQSRIVDLGTRFGVDASNPAHTDVVVFSGLVQVYEQQSGNKLSDLRTGEAMRVKNHRRDSRILNVWEQDASSQWQTGDQAPPHSLITKVSDSMAASEENLQRWPSLRNFYRIVPQGMREGALAFSDEEDQWADVPPSLLGADQVRTFSIDRFNWFMKLTLSLSEPVDLFVFIDQRHPVPDWVQADFKATGETLTLHTKPKQAHGRIVERIPYSIWKRTLHAPGDLLLGAPYPKPPEDRKSFYPNRMFGVAAKRPG
ncbi:MAG: hypothetical protein RLZZ142_714 [Verrucomicrobiota bacterium]